MKLTVNQKYYRRLARKYGQGALIHAAGMEDEYRGKFSSYWYAKEAAWFAFKAHPELRTT